MVRRQMVVLLVSAAVLLIAGCGGPKSEKVKPPSVTPAEAAKTALKEIADSGQVGSGADVIKQSLEKLKGTDAAKADALLKDYETLIKTQNPDAVKAKATEMMGKL
jgi:hypothetical protein